MTCDEYRAARLAGEESAETTAHLAACETCRGGAGSLDETRSLLTDPGVWQRPGADLEERIVGAISEEVAAGSPPDLRSVPPTAHGRRPPWGWLGAAAAVVIIGIAVGILTGNGPDWRIEVPGTEIAPEASAMVEGWNTEAGTRMRVTTTGLPPAPDGYVYQMWLTKDRVHVPGGTFRHGESVELLVGVRRADYPRIWITLEALDDDNSPTWDQTVLDTG